MMIGKIHYENITFNRTNSGIETEKTGRTKQRARTFNRTNSGIETSSVHRRNLPSQLF